MSPVYVIISLIYFAVQLGRKGGKWGLFIVMVLFTVIGSLPNLFNGG